MCLRACIRAQERRESAFFTKVNFRWFGWFAAAMLVYQSCTPIWRLHTKLYKVARNSETAHHRDLRLGEVFSSVSLLLITFNFLDFFPWTVSNLFFFMAWQCKPAIGKDFKKFTLLLELNAFCIIRLSAAGFQHALQLQPCNWKLTGLASTAATDIPFLCKDHLCVLTQWEYSWVGLH